MASQHLLTGKSMAHARIGRVRFKSGNVVAMRGKFAQRNDRREQFVRQAAQAYDSHVRAYGIDPDAVVTVLCGLKQPAEVYWAVRGDSEGGATSILAFAQAALQRALVNP